MLNTRDVTEVQNRGISGPTKKTYFLKILKNMKITVFIDFFLQKQHSKQNQYIWVFAKNDFIEFRK